MNLQAFWAFLMALAKLLGAVSAYATRKEAQKNARAMAMVELLQTLTGMIEHANKADRDFDQRLRDDPDWLLADDGFQRQTSHRIRDST